MVFARKQRKLRHPAFGRRSTSVGVTGENHWNALPQQPGILKSPRRHRPGGRHTLSGFATKWQILR